MIYTYNKTGLQDVVLCYFQPENSKDKVEVEKHNELVVLKQNEQIIGINILHASAQIKTPISEGFSLTAKVDETEQIKQIINKELGFMPESTLKQHFVIGHVTQCEAHPDSDKLSICLVDVGNQVVQIVCGAKNIKTGLFVVVAMVGSMMPSGLLIQPSVLRKVESNGMICSSKELGLPELQDYAGILELPDTATIGMDFVEYYKKELK